MKTAKLNDILEFQNKLVRVTGVMEGKTLILEELVDNSLVPPKYRTDARIYILEHSPNFQDNAKPVSTINEQ